MEATEIDCSVNLTGEILVQRLEMLGDVIQEFYGWLQLPLAIPTLLLLIKHVVTLAQQLRTNKVSKRSSIMLLNRGIGDMVTCISVILIAFYVLLKEPSQSDNIASLLDMFCMCSFWSAMLSNISISLLKLYAFWRPLGYSQTVTVRRCLHLIAVRCIRLFIFMFPSKLRITSHHASANLILLLRLVFALVSYFICFSCYLRLKY
ncbi:hypothetical protein AB6A40_009316 [Gnathostoma spinigerum]|uniref:Uncharacterized protein n=1 Tax=Gnathostoma spinigerum TaxID=75299 RepID=A0ABD6F0F7_9BILA